ncbi:unnamed protein product, partial [Mesorhabditis spiculigera]
MRAATRGPVAKVDPVPVALAKSLNAWDPIALQMLVASNRKLTFKEFQYDNENSKCTSLKLAEAGFYHAGATDATCPFCLKTMSFDPEDDPWAEHKAHCPRCPFVVVNERDEGKWTVRQCVLLIAAIKANSMRDALGQFNAQLNMMEDELDAIKPPTY